MTGKGFLGGDSEIATHHNLARDPATARRMTWLGAQDDIVVRQDDYDCAAGR